METEIFTPCIHGLVGTALLSNALAGLRMLNTCKFDNVLFLVSVTWGIFIFWSRGKDLVKYFSRFLLSELA